MRRVIIILSVIVVVIVLLLVLGASLLNVNRFRPQIEAELQKKLGRPVTLGELHLHLLPFSMKVDSLSIAEAAGFPSSRPFATASEVYASAGLMSLIQGKPQIKDLTLNNPQIELIRNAQGTWNFSTLGSSNSSNQQNGLTLNELKITNGQLAVTDNHSKSPRTVYNHIDLTLTGFAPGKQFNFDADVHFPGPGKELLSFRGQAGPLATGAEATPISGHISIQQIALAGVNSVAPGTIPPKTDAQASGETDLAWQNGTISGKGNLRLDNAVVRGAKVDYPIDAEYSLQIDQKTDRINVSSGTVKMGPTAVSLTGTIDSAVTPSNLNVRVQTSNASITELSRLAALFGAAFDPNDQVKGSISADLTAVGTINSPQIQGTLSASKIQAQDIVLTNVHANTRMKNGVVDLSPVTAGIFGGQEAGDITIDTKAAHPQCSVKTKFSGVDTNALLSAVSSVKDKLYGSLAADANLTFAIDAGANVARTLNGVLNFNVTNGQLKGVNILGELSRIGKFLNAAPAQSSGSDTPLKKFSGTLNFVNGVANTNNLVAAIPEGSLAANGSLNLSTEGIDMHMNAVLADSASKTVGGTGVGGILNTVLANNKGELVIPVLVTGSMAHPTFTPDVQALAKMKLSHLLPTSGDPTKGVSGILGSILGGATGQQSNSKDNQQQQQNPLNSLFNALGKKK
jgi:AsmA protein